MDDIKFIDLEQIYLNTFKSNTEEKEFWGKNYPHIFYPVFNLKHFENNEIFTDYFLPIHHENIMIHNTLYNFLNLGKSSKARYKSISEKYGRDDKKQQNDKKNLKKEVFFPNQGHEKFIQSFDWIDRVCNLQYIESHQDIIKIFIPQFCALIFVKFEEYLSQFAGGTVISDNKNSLSDKITEDEINKFFGTLKEEKKKIYNEIDEKYRYLPTFLKYAKMIDKNCNLEDENSVEGLLKKNRFRNFNNYRNCAIHADFSNRRGTPLMPLDCFYLKKELLDFVYNNNKIISKLEEHENKWSINYA